MEKEIGAEPNSVKFCIAEILRNRLFLEKVKSMDMSQVVSKDKLTGDPLSLDEKTQRKNWKDQMFCDQSYYNHQETKNAILDLLKKQNL